MKKITILLRSLFLFGEKQEAQVFLRDKVGKCKDVLPEGARSCQKHDFFKLCYRTVLVQSIYLEDNNSENKNKVSLNLVITVTVTEYRKRMSAMALILQIEFMPTEAVLCSNLI